MFRLLFLATTALNLVAKQLMSVAVRNKNKDIILLLLKRKMSHRDVTWQRLKLYPHYTKDNKIKLRLSFVLKELSCFFLL